MISTAKCFIVGDKKSEICRTLNNLEWCEEQSLKNLLPNRFSPRTHDQRIATALLKAKTSNPNRCVHISICLYVREFQRFITTHLVESYNSHKKGNPTILIIRVLLSFH